MFNPEIIDTSKIAFVIAIPLCAVLWFLAALTQKSSDPGKPKGFLSFVGWIGAILTLLSSADEGYILAAGVSGWGVAFYIPVLAAMLLMVYCWEAAGVHRILAVGIVFTSVIGLGVIYGVGLALNESTAPPWFPGWIIAPIIVAHLGCGIIIVTEKSWRVVERPSTD